MIYYYVHRLLYCSSFSTEASSSGQKLAQWSTTRSCAERRDFRVLSPGRDVFIIPSAQSSGIYADRGQDRKIVRVKGGGWLSKEVSRNHSTDRHRVSQRLIACTCHPCISSSQTKAKPKERDMVTISWRRSWLQIIAAGRGKIGSLQRSDTGYINHIFRCRWLTRLGLHVSLVSVFFSLRERREMNLGGNGGGELGEAENEKGYDKTSCLNMSSW